MASLAEKIRAEPSASPKALSTRLGCSESFVRGLRSKDRNGMTSARYRMRKRQEKAAHRGTE